MRSELHVHTQNLVGARQGDRPRLTRSAELRQICRSLIRSRWRGSISSLVSDEAEFVTPGRTSPSRRVGRHPGVTVWDAQRSVMAVSSPIMADARQVSATVVGEVDLVRVPGVSAQAIEGGVPHLLVGVDLPARAHRAGTPPPPRPKMSAV